MKSKSILNVMFLMVMVFLFSGCAGSHKYMREVPDSAVNIVPESTQASLIFMRPSGFGFAISSSVFDLVGNENKFIGILPAKKKIIYKTNPGEHMFMVIGESADFMKANLEAGKTYYALVTPRMGVWKARFSLKPVSKNELSSGEFKDWVSGCEFVENTEGSHEWAKENAESIQSKREEYIKKWNEKSEDEKPFLRQGDGL